MHNVDLKKPKLKEFLPVIALDQNTVQIGIEPPLAFEIEDPEQQLQHLLPLLDGSRTVQEIGEALLKKLPDLTVEQLRETIEMLGEGGLLEDAGAQQVLDDWEQIRYKGNLNFLSAFSTLEVSKYDLQKKLTESRVVVLGMGGLGSNLLTQLAGLGVSYLRILDCDEVELKNLNRQILYSEAGVGKRKVIEGKKRLLQYNSRLEIETIERHITSVEDLEDVITNDIDVVFCSADRPVRFIREWVNEICQRKNKPFLIGGTGHTFGQFFSVIPGQSACVTCLHSQESTDSQNIPVTDFNAAIAPNISWIASLIIMEFLRIRLEFAPPVSSGRRTLLHFLTSELSVEDPWPIHADCPHCAVPHHQ